MILLTQTSQSQHLAESGVLAGFFQREFGMYNRRRMVWLAGVAGLALVSSLFWHGKMSAQPQLGNQLPNPRLFTITPLGAKAGTSVEITWTGGDLENPDAFLFSHPGIKAAPVIVPPPKPDPKVKVDPKKPPPPPPPPPPVTKFTITVPADVAPGYYDIRLVNKYGISNPRVFVVGDLNEVVEKEPNNSDEQAQRVEIGTTVNGAITAPIDVDYTVFAGKKGQRVLISCLGASIDSRIGPDIKVLDGKLRELAGHRPLPQHDAAIDLTLPEDGDYYVRVCQFTYTAGNSEFFYRLNISSGPHIDAVHPPMIEPGKAAQVTVYGRNLPGGKADPAAVIDGKVLEKMTVSVTAPNEPSRLLWGGQANPLTALLDGFEYRLKGPSGTSNPFLMTYAQAPVVLENDDNDTPEKAQEVTLPCEIAGRVDKKRDRDWFAFTAKKGDVYYIELLSHRLGAPTDMYFSLRSFAAFGNAAPAAGSILWPTVMPPLLPKQDITTQDDNGNTLHPISFLTANRDPVPFRFVVPADDKYHVLVACHLADNLANPQHYYRLRITPERPDFRLIVMGPDFSRPDSCHLGQGGVNAFTVFAERLDGFRGDITLAVEGLPMSVTCPPQVIGAGVKQSLLVLSAADNAPAWTGEIKIKGTATIQGKPVVREARPASITWPVQPQQNIPTVTRMDRNLVLAVRDKAPFRLVALEKATVFHGDKVNVPLKLNLLMADTKPAGPIQIIPLPNLPNEFPPGLGFTNAAIPPGKLDGNLVLNVGGNVPPGNYTIVFRAFGPIPYGKDPKKKANVNVVLPTTPLALTVLPKQVATLSTANPNLAVKLGAQVEVIVRVARQFDYDGPFKVKLNLPPKAPGITADEITIAPGQNEAKLIVRVAANAPVVNLQNLSLTAQATIQGNVNLNHETKININVTK